VSPYNLGPYSRQRAIERGRISQTQGLRDIFSHIDLDSVPTPDQLDHIWFFMNYRVNFFRLFSETSPVKLEQQHRWLRYIHTLTAPDNALVTYFYGYVEYRVLGQIDSELVSKLENQLAESSYWKERFEFFGLSLDHLKAGEFPVDEKGIRGKMDLEMFAC